MAKRHLLGLLAAGGLALASLEARAETRNYEVPSGTTNITSKAVTGPGSVEILRNTEYKFHARANQGGNVQGVTNEWFPSGYTNQVIAVPSQGYDFSGWTLGNDSISGTQTNNFIVSSVTTNLYANFQKKVYEVIVTDSRAGTPQTFEVEHGESLSHSFDELIFEGGTEASGIRYRATGATTQNIELEGLPLK